MYKFRTRYGHDIFNAFYESRLRSDMNRMFGKYWCFGVVDEYMTVNFETYEELVLCELTYGHLHGHTPHHYVIKD